MTRVRVHNFAISLDGYGAGPRQTRDDPLGVGGEGLHDWYIPTRTFQRMSGKSGGTTGVDDDFAARFGEGVGGWIMGRSRALAEMEGGTVFHFVTGDIHEALERATAAAAGKDVQIGGGVATVRQYIEARLLDELHVAIAPRLLGSGEHLFYGLDLTELGYECTTHVPSAGATHVVFTRRP